MSQALKLVVSLLLIIINSSQHCQVSSFWLTDMTVFQPAIQLSSSTKQQQEAILNQEQNLVKSELERTQESAKSLTSPEEVKLVPKISSTADSFSPWTVRVVKEDNQQPGQQLRIANEQCQCNADWLQNQTSFWLNKWLSSSNAANQMRALVSSSTGATQLTNYIGSGAKRDASQHRTGPALALTETQHSPANNSNHHQWSAWHRATRAYNNANNSQMNGSHHNRPFRRHSQQSNKIMLQGERGPQGPKGEVGARGEKGERGERGERGEAGPIGGSLISVKDRDELFDLASQSGQLSKSSLQSSTLPTVPTSTDVNSNSINKLQVEKQRQLVFVESEQMLVVNTDSGWRPIQLLAPLRDFRKTIAKFSLNSPDERRKLMLATPRNEQKPVLVNSIKASVVREPQFSVDGATMASLGARMNQVGADSFVDNQDGSDEEDDDEEEDEEDDERDELGLSIGRQPNKLKVEDGFDEDEDDEEDEDENETTNLIGSDEQNKLQAAESNRRAEKVSPNGRSQVSGRSLAAALVSASIDNSITVKPSSLVHHKHANSAKGSQDEGADRRMKLRMAALNEPFSGNIHGIRGADFECRRNAARANVKGSFRAFLASGFQNLNEVVRYNVDKYPIVNLRGETLANSWHDLFKQTTRVGNPMSRLYSFDGRHVATNSNWPNKLVWHGANTKAGHRDSIHNCDGWHSDSLNKFAFATPLHPPHRGGVKKRLRKRYLADNVEQSSSTTEQVKGQQQQGASTFLNVIEKYPCKMPLIVLCIETIGQQLDPAKELQSLSNNHLENNNLVLA